MNHPGMGYPEFDKLNRTIHEPVRLAILSLLHSGYRPDFRYLSSTLGLTDGNLAFHLQVLSDAGYIRTERVLLGGRMVTQYGPTKQATADFAEYKRVIATLLGGLLTPEAMPQY